MIQHSCVDLTSSGREDFPPWPNLETVCLHPPPSVEGPDLRRYKPMLCYFSYDNHFSSSFSYSYYKMILEY